MVIEINLPHTVLFEQSNCIDRNISIFWYLFHMMLPVELWETSFKSVHFLLTEAIKENYIISLFDSKCIRWWVDVICLQDKHNINEVPLTIKCMCIRRKICERLCEPRLYPSFSRIIHIKFIFYHIVYVWIHLVLSDFTTVILLQ